MVMFVLHNILSGSGMEMHHGGGANCKVKMLLQKSRCDFEDLNNGSDIKN